MRGARIFLSGVGGLIALFFVFTYPRQAVLAFTATLGILVVAGFCIPVPHWIVSVQSGFRRTQGGHSIANPFPALVAFETEVRNLWILIFSPLFALGVAAATIGHLDQRWPDGPFSAMPNFFLLKIAAYITAAAVYCAWWWFRERWLLRKAEAVPGFAAAISGSYGSFQYYDFEGELRCGMSHVWGPVTEPYPVFMHAKNPDFSKPGFGFLFHRFRETDARNVPSAVMRNAQAAIVLRARNSGAFL